MTKKPEEEARELIDAKLVAAGWVIQDADDLNLYASLGVAVREVKLDRGYGKADYILFVDGKAAGVVEAKKTGATLTGVEIQSQKYSDGFPAKYEAYRKPLPFLYESNGEEIRFTNRLDPDPRSRDLFHFHKPETIAEELRPGASGKLSSLRSRLCHLPALDTKGLWPSQIKAVNNLEESLKKNRPRALIQMATGSGKTHMAISTIYRLIKFADARRVLFLVDRKNLGQQAHTEFQAYTTPDDGRKFTELYNVNHLKSNKIGTVDRVVITTIQRAYSMLRGDEELDPELETGSQFDTGGELIKDPPTVVYNLGLPPEYFDLIFIDECHRSIYSLWQPVLLYFDAFLVGLTATPSKRTFGFFKKNLVMEYGHDDAVADRVNVDFNVYRIETQITKNGATVVAGLDTVLIKRDKLTRRQRWERLDDDLTYDAGQLDRAVVATDQIRTVLTTFKDKLFTEIFPGRTDVPKTLIFAKDDSHADDIVKIVREVFDRGNDFAQKITYRTTGEKPEDLIKAFRNSYNPRIAVTVDMIATGTDIKPLEIVMFMRTVRSLNYFEQMKGRGVRVIGETEFQAVTQDAKRKTHFVIVDCVGVCEMELQDTTPIDRKPTESFEKLLKEVAYGSTDAAVLSAVASRLIRFDQEIDDHDRATLAEQAGGIDLRGIAAGIIHALDHDKQVEQARKDAGLSADEEPTDAQVKAVAKKMVKEAAIPIASKPEFRKTLLEMKKRSEQTIDILTPDKLIVAEFSDEARKKAKKLVQSFEKYIEDNKDEITALQILYSKPRNRSLSFEDIKQLSEAITSPPRSWTPERLWNAYELLKRHKVRGAGRARLLSDIVSLVRFAMHQEDELIPFADKVNERFENWLAQQKTKGRSFTNEQLVWLQNIKDHVAGSLRIDQDDFELPPFNQQGGLGRVYQLFGDQLNAILNDLNRALTA